MENYSIIIFICLLTSTTELMAQQVEIPIFHKSHVERKKNAPFSDAVQVGNLFFLSGQIGMDNHKSEVVSGGITAETEQTIHNIQEVLRQHGMELENVIKCTVILRNIDDFAAFNEVYTGYFPQKPVRTTFAASGLAMDAKIEIEVVAVKIE
ncbi:Putative aminoacrylate peracid reductase RutC [Arenibacter antarcticus]|uniref:RidA family protein n=1 Tax=Arenibacter antarcticus TaxID=2040469 RepID=A0ABW5VEN8_9FLAO|nr:RidA family protein [Arenibacter sp. H213]MCM4168562.1 reactive intermediate/imine deaminase [Arenibacter sp. H213]